MFVFSRRPRRVASGPEMPLSWIQAAQGEFKVYVAESGPYDLEIRISPGNGCRLRIWQIRREDSPLLLWDNDGYDLTFAQARAERLVRRIQAVSKLWEWHIQETYKGLITLSVEALKSLALVNGGAAVALLTYAGNRVVHQTNAHLPHLSRPLLWYCLGLLSTVVAFFCAYWTQLTLYQEERAIHERAPQRDLPRWRFHRIGIWGAATLALFAVAAFGLGCWSAASALRKAGAL